MTTSKKRSQIRHFNGILHLDLAYEPELDFLQYELPEKQ